MIPQPRVGGYDIVAIATTALACHTSPTIDCLLVRKPWAASCMWIDGTSKRGMAAVPPT